MSFSDTIPERRKPAVAGRFYGATKEALRSEVGQHLKEARAINKIGFEPKEKIRALIVPHAGYIFSGKVAASAYNLLDIKKQEFDRVILLGVSHYANYGGVSVFRGKYYETPLGEVAVDQEMIEGLVQKHSFIDYMPAAHLEEHSLEVQLPFLQHTFGQRLKIVPMLIGNQSPETAEQLAELLKPWFSAENLFIVSTDLSHYPSYSDAKSVDNTTIQSLCRNNPQEFIKRIKDNHSLNIPNLATSMCGWTAALTLLYLTSGREDMEYQPVLYQNSGDISVYGEKSRVVGYQSVLLKEHDKSKRFALPELTSAEQKKLIHIAYQAICRELKTGKPENTLRDQQAGVLSQKLGAFVSLYVDGQLRGCIGRIHAVTPLAKLVNELAGSASVNDCRFDPISVEELHSLTIEISVLSPLRMISDISEIIPGMHGIYIKHKERSGTFLPQVAKQQGWDVKHMLTECVVRKMGLGQHDWKNAEIFTYETKVFRGKPDQQDYITLA